MSSTENVLKDLLRIITPDEISKLIESSEKKERVSLTNTLNQDLVQKEQDLIKNNASKFEGKKPAEEPKDSEEQKNDETVEVKKEEVKEEKKEEDSEKNKTEVIDEQKDEEISVAKAETSSTKGHSIFGYEEEVVIEEKVDIVDFIIEEQRKSKIHKEKLQEIEIMSLYKKGSGLTIKRTDEKSKKESRLSTFGVLINKRRK